ncbi:hypothetical protein ACFV1F_21930, partial [Streptomyces sp. NPDC059590]
MRRGAPGALWRAAVVAALLCGIGLLPWLSRTDPALTVLEARSAERDPAPEVLAAIRGELGLDAGPVHLLGRWLGGRGGRAARHPRGSAAARGAPGPHPPRRSMAGPPTRTTTVRRRMG